MTRQSPLETGSGSAEGAVTMETVGRLAGVSQVTVSRALNAPDKVSAETLRRVREAIAVTGYVPNALAGALASRRSRLVAALVPSLTNVVYSSTVHSLSETLRPSGYQLMLSETGMDPEAEETLIATHLSRRPDAIVLTGVSHTRSARRMLLAAGIPVVELWDITESPVDLCVGFSHLDIGRDLARLALAKGYTEAATVVADIERARRRRQGFASVWAEATGRTVASAAFSGEATLAAGRQALADLIDTKGFGSGLVQCSSDVLAHGVLTEAMARGLRVPKDLAVIGFGDQDIAAHTHPSLTTVRVDRAELGLRAAQAILARLEGTPSAAIHDLGFTIVTRASA